MWHADQNFGSREAMIMNFPTRPYNRAHPDKHRVDPHSDAIPFDWAQHAREKPAMKATFADVMDK